MIARLIILIAICNACAICTEAVRRVSTEISIHSLLAHGKEAISRYTSNPTVHVGAIIDAAVAYEFAYRLTTSETDLDTVREIHSNLYWCHKQMSEPSSKQFRARIESLPRPKAFGATQALTPAPSKQAKAEKESQTTSPAVSKPSRQVDSQQLDLWVARLQERVRNDVARQRQPFFFLNSMKTNVTIRYSSSNNVLTLALDHGEITYPWRLLSPQDLASLASSIPAGDDQAGYALAAFFSFSAGDEIAGSNSLRRSGAHAAEVERSFQIADPR